MTSMAASHVLVESRMLGNGHVRFGARRRGNQRPKGRHGASPPTLHLALPEDAAELVFQVISERNERASLIVITSLPFGEWTKVFPTRASPRWSSTA